MRINYTEDEDFPGQFGLWQANCRRSLKSKAGQAALRRLEAALLAMPEKRLVKGALVATNGQVCAIGALARAEGKLPAPPTEDEDWDDEPDAAEFASDTLGFPHLVAWKVVEQNDIQNDVEYQTAEGPRQYPYGYSGGGYRVAVDVTPELRYERVLAWVRKQIVVR